MPLGPTGCMRLNPANTLFIQVHDDLLQGGYDQDMEKSISGHLQRGTVSMQAKAIKSSVARCSSPANKSCTTLI